MAPRLAAPDLVIVFAYVAAMTAMGADFTRKQKDLPTYFVGVPVAIVLVGVVTIVYTYLGGMKAVLWTDLVQFAIKIAGAALALWFVIDLLPGGWDQLVSVGEAAKKFTLIDLSTDPTKDLTL